MHFVGKERGGKVPSGRTLGPVAGRSPSLREELAEDRMVSASQSTGTALKATEQRPSWDDTLAITAVN